MEIHDRRCQTSSPRCRYFAHYGLAPDLSRGLLTDFSNFTIIRGGLTTAQNVRLVATTSNAFGDLLDVRPALTALTFKADAPNHGVVNHIPTRGPPVFARARRLSPEKLAAVKKEFDTLVSLGIIRPSSSPWASPLHCVRKPDGSWRPCGDFRRLNTVTDDDRYPIRNLQDFNADQKMRNRE